MNDFTQTREAQGLRQALRGLRQLHGQRAWDKEARIQESEARSQDSGARSQESAEG